MAKVTGPLISGSARGSFGSAFYYRRSPAGTIACATVAPSNPQTILQQANRNKFQYISPAWREIKIFPGTVAEWEQRRRHYRKNPTPYHEFVSSYKMAWPPTPHYMYMRNFFFNSITITPTGGTPAYDLSIDFTFDYLAPPASGGKWCFGESPYVTLWSTTMAPPYSYTWTTFSDIGGGIPWNSTHLYHWVEPISSSSVCFSGLMYVPSITIVP